MSNCPRVVSTRVLTLSPTGCPFFCLCFLSPNTRLPDRALNCTTIALNCCHEKKKQKLFYRRHSSSELNARYLDTYLSQYGSVLPPCYLKHRQDGSGADKVPIPLTHPANCPPNQRGVKVGGALNRAIFLCLRGVFFYDLLLFSECGDGSRMLSVVVGKGAPRSACMRVWDAHCPPPLRLSSLDW